MAFFVVKCINILKSMVFIVVFFVIIPIFMACLYDGKTICSIKGICLVISFYIENILNTSQLPLPDIANLHLYVSKLCIQFRPLVKILLQKIFWHRLVVCMVTYQTELSDSRNNAQRCSKDQRRGRTAGHNFSR